MASTPRRPDPTAPLRPFRLQEVKLRLVRSGRPPFTARCAGDVARALRYLASEVRESLVVLCLNATNGVICLDRVSTGGVGSTTVDPAEIIRTALLVAARALIVCHNHPSGSIEPSADDRQVTQRVREAAALFHLALLDHVIVGTEGRYYSFAEAGGLPQAASAGGRGDPYAPTYLVSWIESQPGPCTVIERAHLVPAEKAKIQEALRQLEAAGRILRPSILPVEQPPLSYRSLLRRYPILEPRPGQPSAQREPAGGTQLRLEGA